jgi:hypothetical protein
LRWDILIRLEADRREYIDCNEDNLIKGVISMQKDLRKECKWVATELREIADELDRKDLTPRELKNLKVRAGILSRIIGKIRVIEVERRMG